MIIVGGLILWKTSHIVRITLLPRQKTHPLKVTKVPSESQSEEGEESFEQKHRSYKMMFEPYKDRSFITRGHLFFFTIRIILCYLIIGLLYDYPIVQMCFLTLINVLMIANLVFLKPMKEFEHFIESLTFELLLFAVNICVLMYAIIDKKVGPDHPLRNSLATAISICNSAVRVVSLLFVCYSLVNESIGILFNAFPWLKPKLSMMFKRAFSCLYNKQNNKVMALDLEGKPQNNRSGKHKKSVILRILDRLSGYGYDEATLNQETATPSPNYPRAKKNSRILGSFLVQDDLASKPEGEKSASSTLLRLKGSMQFGAQDFEETTPLGLISPGQGSHTDRVYGESQPGIVKNLKSVLTSEFALELTNAQSYPKAGGGSLGNSFTQNQGNATPGGAFDPFELSFPNTGRSSLDGGGRTVSLSNLLPQWNGSEGSRTRLDLNITRFQRHSSVDAEPRPSNLLIKRILSNGAVEQNYNSSFESKEGLTDRDIILLKNTEDWRKNPMMNFGVDPGEQRKKRLNLRLAGLAENLKIELGEASPSENINDLSFEERKPSIKTAKKTKGRPRLPTIDEGPKVLSLEEIASPVKIVRGKKKISKKIELDKLDVAVIEEL